MSLEAREDVTRHVPRAAGAARALSFGREASSRGASPFILRVRRRGAGAVLAVLLSAGGANAAKVACGNSHTCAIRDDGNVWCWGTNQDGQLGMGSTGGSSANPVGPVDLGVGRTAKAISAGLSNNCVILDDDTLKCWGSGGSGQLGYSDTTNRNAPPATPVDLGAGRTAKAVSCGDYHTCAILDDDSLKCWGSGYGGQLGYGDSTDRYSPTAVDPTNLGAGVKSVAAGQEHTCAVLNDGSLKCWGNGLYVSLGYGDNSYRYTPPADNVNLGAGRTAKSVSATYRHTCVILNDDTLKCYGTNGYAQLGYGDTTQRTVPDASAIDLGSGKTATSVSTGSDTMSNDFTCAERREFEMFRHK